MTGILVLAALSISIFLTVEFSRTIAALHRQNAALGAAKRKAGGFDV